MLSLMKQIILDTNFLLIPAQFKVDIFSEIERIIDAKYELAVLSTTIAELEKATKQGKGKDKDAARIALQLIDAKKIRKLQTTQTYVDKAILDIAAKDKTIVATQDRELKRKLKKQSIPVIVMRRKSHLELIER